MTLLPLVFSLPRILGAWAPWDISHKPPENKVVGGLWRRGVTTKENFSPQYDKKNNNHKRKEEKEKKKNLAQGPILHIAHFGFYPPVLFLFRVQFFFFFCSGSSMNLFTISQLAKLDTLVLSLLFLFDFRYLLFFLLIVFVYWIGFWFF